MKEPMKKVENKERQRSTSYKNKTKEKRVAPGQYREVKAVVSGTPQRKPKPKQKKEPTKYAWV